MELEGASNTIYKNSLVTSPKGVLTDTDLE